MRIHVLSSRWHIVGNQFCFLVFVACILLVRETRADWPEWAGPHRDFHVRGVKLADAWPEQGPRMLWRRKLGDGYSSIVTSTRPSKDPSELGRKILITMYRSADLERIVALSTQTGETVWEHKYEAEFREGTDVKQFGPGPLATPLIVDDSVCCVGITGNMHCLDLNDGSVRWKADLLGELGGTNLFRGYSSSPIRFRDTAILPVGGKGQGLVAFRVSDGSIAWRQHDFQISHVSPIMATVDGQMQLVAVAHETIVGCDPVTGRLLWRHDHPIDGGYVSSTPVQTAKGDIFFSAAYGHGSYCVRIEEEQGEYSAVEAWKNHQMRVHHSNVIRIDNVLFGTSGDFSAIFFAAVDSTSGKLLWHDRKLGRSNCLFADGKCVMLREDGTLFLAKLTRKEAIVLSEKKLFDGRAWTSPTLDKNRLFIRNREEIMALELP